MLDRIEIAGYRRLLDASAYVGRRTVAFVGPNEAGKSSVLSALRLFNTDDPLPATDATRSLRGHALDPQRWVVRLRFTLDAEQVARSAALPIEAGELKHVHWTKRADGSFAFAFHPAARLKPTVSSELKAAWPRLERQLRSRIETSGTRSASRDDVDEISSFVRGSAPAPGDDVWDRIHEDLEHSDSSAHNKRVDAFRLYYEWARPSVSLQQKVRQAIATQRPEFAQYRESHRDLRAEYGLSNGEAEASEPLRNLLRLGQITVQQILDSQEDSGYQRSIVDDANRRLEAFFTTRWKQEKVTVGVVVDGDVLRVHVKDLVDGSPGWMDISERSDGLRTFVALAAFLESGGFDRPPILLIDEAEHHLHQNAQVDLIRMLQGLTAVQQVIYTTHSPACLPADLGNGVRFVEPIERGHSRIRHDFWSLDRNEHVGFNPLLMVMGAGAAAFSSLRSALIAEGVSDMLLLPTLIKVATGESELEYQVSPGIATASTADMAKLDFIASRVVYLVDGDDAGVRWRAELETAGVPRNRIRNLADGMALEDLLERQFYLDIIAELGALDREVLNRASDEGPIKMALGQIRPKITAPGPVAVAEYILGRHESSEAPIRLSSRGRRQLKELHSWVVRTVGI